MRHLVLRAAMAMAAALSVVLIGLSSPASASGSGPQTTTSCADYVSNGNMFQSGIFTGCTHRASTGGSGTLAVVQRPASVKITWRTGKTTTLDLPYITQPITDESEQSTCPAGMQENLWHADVVADSTGSIGVGGHLSGEVCINFSNVTSRNEPYARISFT